MNKVVNQRELQQKVSTLEAMKNQVEALQQQKELLDETIKRHDEAKKTMKNYKEEDEGTEVLVPIGADSYIHTEVSNNEQVLIGLGAELSAERDIEDALETIERKKENIKDDKEELQEEIDELSENAEELENEVRQEYQELQKQQGQQQGGGQVFR
ncbi:MAG: prefoldin subunit alpha [Candidatus Thermoplasmatota archaeon]